ncbi:MAG: hypothetical protein U0163_15835 [Gemmatimonadaceae bacterium]
MQTFPPYAVRPTQFPFRALALLVGRLPLGGSREVALAALMAARLASASDGAELTPSARRERAAAARAWCSTLSLPLPVRTALLRVIQATESGDAALLKSSLSEVMVATEPLLDSPSRGELRRLAIERNQNSGVSA